MPEILSNDGSTLREKFSNAMVNKLPLEPSESHVLTSWKEVAAYLGKGVRTVQRWERELSLPVRRPYGMEKHVIVALPDELDHWMRTRMRPREYDGRGHPHDAAKRSEAAALRSLEVERLHRLIRVMVERTDEMRRRCNELLKRTSELKVGNRENLKLRSQTLAGGRFSEIKSKSADKRE